jgi:hypothetical protein
MWHIKHLVTKNKKRITMANPIHDSPDKTYLKVDFGTILKRRRRTPEDYVRTQGITSGTVLESHLIWLSKTYVVSDKFANACRIYVRKLEKTSIVLKPEEVKEAAPTAKQTTRKKRTSRAKSKKGS